MPGLLFCVHARGMLSAHLTLCMCILQWSILPESNRPWNINMSVCSQTLAYICEWSRIKLISVQYLQCSVFIGVCVLIDSELVIPCDVNRGYELWSSARGCRPVLDQSCIAVNTCAGFEWVIFPDTVHLALGLSLWPGLAFSFVDSNPFGWLLWQLCPCCLRMRRPSLSAPPRVLWFIQPYLWFTVEVWHEPTSLIWALKGSDLLRTETPSTLI